MSSHLFFCFPCFLPHFRVPCKMVLARPVHTTSIYVFTMVRRSPCCRLLAGSWHGLPRWSLYEMCSILRQHLISMTCILLWSSAVRVHDSHAYRKMHVTRKRISGFLEMRQMLLLFQTGFNLLNAAAVYAIPESIQAWNPSQL